MKTQAVGDQQAWQSLSAHIADSRCQGHPLLRKERGYKCKKMGYATAPPQAWSGGHCRASQQAGLHRLGTYEQQDRVQQAIRQRKLPS